jgi:hypothetical protein
MLRAYKCVHCGFIVRANTKTSKDFLEDFVTEEDLGCNKPHKYDKYHTYTLSTIDTLKYYRKKGGIIDKTTTADRFTQEVDSKGPEKR